MDINIKIDEVSIYRSQERALTTFYFKFQDCLIEFEIHDEQIMYQSKFPDLSHLDKDKIKLFKETRKSLGEYNYYFDYNNYKIRPNNMNLLFEIKEKKIKKEFVTFYIENNQMKISIKGLTFADDVILIPCIPVPIITQFEIQEAYPYLWLEKINNTISEYSEIPTVLHSLEFPDSKLFLRWNNSCLRLKEIIFNSVQPPHRELENKEKDEKEPNIFELMEWND